MSWNEPGDRDEKGKKKDPWGRQNDDQGPPNIDEALRQFQRKLRSIFSQGEGGGGNFNPKPSMGGAPKKWSFMLFGGILLLIYFVWGIFLVRPAEEAVILKLGRYDRTVTSGYHWMAPIIETKYVVNIQELKTIKLGGQMLTKGENEVNIVSAEITVDYRINNVKDYLFNLAQPERSIQQVAESALRAVVGQSTLDEVLTSGRSEIGLEIRKQIQQNLNNYQSGIEISDVAIQQTKAPEEVKTAFDDAIKAQQDEGRLVNEAEAYRQKIIPIAEGRAKRTIEEAKAYRERAILQAKGKTAKFEQLLPEYKRAPQVTRERMYLETLEEVYTVTPKILIDVNGGNNLVYLPLDKLMSKTPSPDQPVKEEDNSLASADKINQNIVALPHRSNDRPSYEDATRPTRDGA